MAKIGTMTNSPRAGKGSFNIHMNQILTISDHLTTPSKQMQYTKSDQLCNDHKRSTDRLPILGCLGVE